MRQALVFSNKGMWEDRLIGLKGVIKVAEVKEGPYSPEQSLKDLAKSMTGTDDGVIHQKDDVPAAVEHTETWAVTEVNIDIAWTSEDGSTFIGLAYID